LESQLKAGQHLPTQQCKAKMHQNVKISAETAFDDENSSGLMGLYLFMGASLRLYEEQNLFTFKRPLCGAF